MSPNQLISQQPYTLSYFITDPNDNNTYYVRAVVYDATTGEILDTQNLTRQTTNTHLFSKRAQAPGDSSGHGRKIVVIATAYDDSGYTTKSSIYQEQSENYIVTKPNNVALGGGGFGIDYNVVKDIVSGEVDRIIGLEYYKKILELLKEIKGIVSKIPTTSTDLSQVTDSLNSLKQAVGKLPTTTTDINPIKKLVEQAIQAINDKEVTESTDLAPISSAIEDLKSGLEDHHKDNINAITPLLEAIKQGLPPLLEKCIREAVEKQKFGLELVGLTAKGKMEDNVPKEKKPSVDIKSLM